MNSFDEFLANKNMSFGEFFTWCEGFGLTKDRSIAQAFRLTPQTVMNWRKGKSRAQYIVLPIHLLLMCRGYEAIRRDSGHVMPEIPTMTIGMFDIWRQYYGLTTLETAGHSFGMTRQAIHNWNTRRRLPKWLPLACYGYSEMLTEWKTVSVGQNEPEKES